MKSTEVFFKPVLWTHGSIHVKLGQAEARRLKDLGFDVSDEAEVASSF